ncbi:MAG TPA: 16S rRNA (adenine(1518)-N(6)/adenine(1519)-N(6))-dimethyltransferase RsmA [Rhodanobacteraceae bacterium]
MSARPKKQFGQHFLHDRRYIDRIIGALKPRDGERIVEIGPGEGALTLPLLAQIGQLTAIELDSDLIPALQARAASIGQLEIIQRDVLQTDLTALAAGAPLRVVGNLPYYISSPIIFHCLDHAGAITDMHFMLQKEVVERMAAAPGSKIYGRLSVMLQLACRVVPLFDVPPEAFRPPPKVNSAVVRLLPLAPAERPDVDAKKLDRVVKAAFGKRRKTLSNALDGVLAADAITAAGVDPRARAETLAPMQFVDLARALA